MRAQLRTLRTTVTLADDVADAVEPLRPERSIGVSEAVNELVRARLMKHDNRRLGFDRNLLI
jgi:hypothetical protein